MNIVLDYNLYKIGVCVKVKVCIKGIWINLFVLDIFLLVFLVFFNI